MFDQEDKEQPEKLLLIERHFKEIWSDMPEWMKDHLIATAQMINARQPSVHSMN